MVIDDVFAVIAESTRRGILTSLRTGDKAVGELVEEMGVSQPTVSKHLKVLREAGLVSMRAEGQKRYYALEPGPLATVATWLAWFDVAPSGGAAAPASSNGASAEQPAVPTAVAADYVSADGHAPQPFQRSLGRAAGRAADLFSSLPKLRRRKDG